MSEREARFRLRQAIGDWPPPPALADLARGWLDAPAPPRTAPRLLVVAALTALVLAVLLGWRWGEALRAAPVVPAAPPTVAATPAATPGAPTPTPLPAPVLGALGLSASLVTPLDLSATDRGVTLTAIGAYADPARTLIIVKTDPSLGMPTGAELTDSTGPVNASGGGSRAGEPGYWAIHIDAGPHPDATGVADVVFTFTSVLPAFDPNATPGAARLPKGTWRFAFAVPVQASQSLLPAGSQYQVGGTAVTVEVAEATPTVVHVQVLENGFPLGSASAAHFVALRDAAGQELQPIVAGGGITGANQGGTPAGGGGVRFNYQWSRPPAGSYDLVFSYGRATLEVPITVG